MSHLADAKAYHASLNAYASTVGLRSGPSWASWRRHPIANLRFWFWCNVPHRPKMHLNVSSVGSVDHEYRDAELLWLTDRCERCGYAVEMGSFVPAQR